MYNLNVTKIASRIKREKYLAWQLKDGTHYITNRHYALVLKALDPKIFTSLLVYFDGQQPEEGSTIHRWKNKDIFDNGPDISKVCKMPDKPIAGRFTPFQFKQDKDMLQIIKLDNGKLVCVDTIYTAMVDDTDQILTTDSDNPVYPIWLGKSFMVLPFRAPIEEEIENWLK